MSLLDVTVNKAHSLDGEYFRVRLKLLGPEKYVEFVRGECPHWIQPRNLIIARNVYESVVGKPLPGVTPEEVQAEKDAEIRELRAKLAEKTEPVAVPVVKEVEPVVEEEVQPKGVRRGRSST